MNHQIQALELVPKVMAISIGNSKNMRAFVDNEGGIWFCLRDVLEAMGSKTRPADAKAVISDIFGAGSLTTTHLDTGFGIKPTIFAHESATTYLIANGNTETSKSLNRKIHAEILPELRKTGRYELKTLTREERLAQSFLDACKIIEEKDARIEQEKLEHKKTGMKLLHTEQIVKAQAPKVDFAETVMKSDKDVSLSQGMKILGIPKPNNMMAVLRNGIVNGEINNSFKWLQRRGGKNYPMQTAVNNGWLRSSVVTNSAGLAFEQTLITMQGLDQLRLLIKKYGIPEEAQ